MIETSDRGYADIISAMYAYDPDKQDHHRIQVVDMRETPGLGDRIGSDRGFLDNFKDLNAKFDPDESSVHPITVVKHGAKKNAWEIDAISGATISSRAVGRMLQKSVAADDANHRRQSGPHQERETDERYSSNCVPYSDGRFLQG